MYTRVVFAQRKIGKCKIANRERKKEMTNKKTENTNNEIINEE